MIKYLKLNQHFDIQAMQREVSELQGIHWKSHYNTKFYEGDWSILPLRSILGDTDNIVSVHTGLSEKLHVYCDTPLLNQCHYIKEILTFFECEKTSVRLMKLHAGAIIKEHQDHEMSYEEGEARFHIPIFTNSKVEFFVDQEQIKMQQGECWYVNLSLKHKVTNGGIEDRIHLVIDCKVNDWIKKIFTEEASIIKEVENIVSHNESREEKEKIIRELRLMNTAISIELADKMEKEL